jgi:glycosyltransferase involved in cell wall biosynthesis
MAATPAVTVLLPVYNGERHLAESLDSVLTQTFTDFEFLIVDDGSTDGSPAMLAAYAARDPRIRVHRQPANAGITATLNAGCRLARAPLIAITNQDDVCLPSRLERQVAYLAQHPNVGLLGAWADLIDEDGRFQRVKQYPAEPAMATWSMVFLSSILHPVATVRRDVLERIGFYPVGYGGGSEDYALGIKISQISQVCSLPEVLVRYRFHAGNFSKKRWDEQESEANRIVAEGVEHALGRPITHELAARLRGLSTDQFTRDPAVIKALGAVTEDLHRAFTRRDDFRPAQLGPVHRDAAIRLWLLSALAASRAPRLAASLAARATAIDALSGFAFARKAIGAATRRVQKRVRSR